MKHALVIAVVVAFLVTWILVGIDIYSGILKNFEPKRLKECWSVTKQDDTCTPCIDTFFFYKGVVTFTCNVLPERPVGYRMNPNGLCSCGHYICLCREKY